MVLGSNEVEINGELYEIVWNGALDRERKCIHLIGPRRTRTPDGWTPPPRIYNKTGNHARKAPPNQVRGVTEIFPEPGREEITTADLMGWADKRLRQAEDSEGNPGEVEING